MKDESTVQQEMWKDVTGFEGYYQISNLGRVKSVTRTIIRRDGVKVNYKERILKKYTNPKGYELVDLRKDSNRDTRTVHRLVAETFLGKNDLQVNHKDGVKINNKLCNLEYVSNRLNINHRSLYIKNKKRFGVHFHKHSNKWKVEIGFEGRYIYLGVYSCKEEAYKVYKNKYIELHGVAPW